MPVPLSIWATNKKFVPFFVHSKSPSAASKVPTQHYRYPIVSLAPVRARCWDGEVFPCFLGLAGGTPWKINMEHNKYIHPP